MSRMPAGSRSGLRAGTQEDKRTTRKVTGDETTLAALEKLARGANFAKPSRGGTVYLRPGELFVGQANRIFTLLGACVAITLWHPGRRTGGMCHFMLPARPVLGHHNPDARYGDEAFQMLCDAASGQGVPPQECEFRVFGGADLVGSQSMLDNLGTRNVACALHQIAIHRHRAVAMDVGGDRPRVVEFDLAEGIVRVRREIQVPLPEMDVMPSAPMR
jgi:chemotaxis protein CheD